MLKFAPRTRKLAFVAASAFGLGLLVLGSGCRGTPAIDAGLDLQADLLAPDLIPTPDGPPALRVGEFLDFSADPSGKVVGLTSVTGSEKFLALLLSLDDPPLRKHKYTAAPTHQPADAPGRLVERRAARHPCTAPP